MILNHHLHLNILALKVRLDCIHACIEFSKHVYIDIYPKPKHTQHTALAQKKPSGG